MQQRLRLTQSKRDKNSSLLGLFDGQMQFLFEFHQHVGELTSKVEAFREGKDSLTVQLSKLQKDNKQISTMSAQSQKYRS